MGSTTLAFLHVALVGFEILAPTWTSCIFKEGPCVYHFLQQPFAL